MKKMSTKIMISLLAFVLTFIGLGASTFAWFTMASTNTVENIQFNITSGAGLEISLGGENFTEFEWKANLTATEVQAALSDQLKLDAITTTDGKNFYSLSVEADGSSTNNLVPIGLRNRVFIQIPLYFRAVQVEIGTATTNGLGVYLFENNNSATWATRNDQSGSFIISEGVIVRNGVAYTTSNGTPVTAEANGTYYASEAMRISFVDVSAATTSDLVTTAIETGEGKIFDFSENPQYGYAFGTLTNGLHSYYQAKTSIALTLPTTEPTVNKVNAAIPGDNDGFSSIDSSNNNVASDNKSLIATMYGVLADGTLVELPDGHQSSYTYEYYVAKCYMSVWIEGWDMDSYDVVLEDNIFAQMAFKLGYKPVA